MTLRCIFHPATVNCAVKRRFCRRGPHHPSPSSPPPARRVLPHPTGSGADRPHEGHPRPLQRGGHRCRVRLLQHRHAPEVDVHDGGFARTRATRTVQPWPRPLPRHGCPQRRPWEPAARPRARRKPMSASGASRYRSSSSEQAGGGWRGSSEEGGGSGHSGGDGQLPSPQVAWLRVRGGGGRGLGEDVAA